MVSRNIDSKIVVTTSIGDLEPINCNEAPLYPKHCAVASRRVLNLARTSGRTGKSDVISRSSRLCEVYLAAVIIRTRCDLHPIACRRLVIEYIIGRGTRTGLRAGVGIAACG